MTTHQGNGHGHSFAEVVEHMAKELRAEWESPRWAGIRRDYTAEEVVRLRGSVPVEHTLAKAGAQRLHTLLEGRPYVPALGALTGGQAIQMVKAGLEAIYLSGWQTAADNNTAGQMYPDQSLYPVSSVPEVVRRINNSLRRADQIEWSEGKPGRHWMAPIVADAEAGFGGALNAFELTKALIESGAAAIHFEDQLASEKKCGHMGGKVLIPTQQHVKTLQAARLAADVCGVPTLIIARTDALSATLLTSDVDPRDQAFTTGERTAEGFYVTKAGMESVVSRALAYAPYCDLLWFETSKPDMAEARVFAKAIHARFPGKKLAYNCSPSFNWKRHLDDAAIARFQKELGELGYKFQFITLAGFHALNASMFELATGYAKDGMTAYVGLQEREIGMEGQGYTATKHQREVGTGYFDEVAKVLSRGAASTLALEGSTEAEQFQESKGREAA
ncbi:MAG TPA: isocitrate lyase [Planctomycetota bacterium]|nr:isocitrate lyase [Planctomycetota bacterium]